MSTIRIDQVIHTETRQRALLEDRAKRLHLFTHSRFEAERPSFAGIGKADLSALRSSKDGQHKESAEEETTIDETITITLKNGQVITLPTLSDDEKSRVEKIFSQLPKEARERLRASALGLGQAGLNTTLANSAQDQLAATSALYTAGQGSYETYVTTTGTSEYQSQSEDLIFLGVYGAQENLVNYFGRVQYNQGIANEIRTDIAELQDLLADWPDDGSVQEFTYHDATINEDGSVTVTEHTVELTKEEAQALLDRLQGQETSLGTLDNQSMMTLQMMVQKYQQAVNTISNVIKNQDETRRGIIGNLKA